jgi:glycosyltransferase involved in cell wall biosynthesis
VAHYTSALLGALAEGFPDDEWRLLVPGRDAVAEGVLRHENVTVRRTLVPGRLLHGAGAVSGRPHADRLLGDDLDVLWSPALSPLSSSGACPVVLTVHDLSFEQRPRDFTLYERVWHRLARPRGQATRAARVIVNAGPVRDAVLERWQIDPQRVCVIPEGVTRPVGLPSPEQIEDVRRRHGVGERYLLAVGALEPRKAPELLARAHAQARAEGLDAELVFAGRGRLARRLRATDAHLLGHVPGADLQALYAGALALVMPSYLEGFGLPPLEALAHGTAAVVSDLPVYRETLGEGALRFPAGDERALVQALLTVAADRELRERLVAAGQRAIAPLTWERTAVQTRAVLAAATGEA